jgi:ubiquinone/menaquinone biosynthesis C-methylase UbiE
MTNSNTIEAKIECLANGAPHSQEAAALCELFASLPDDAVYDFIRCYITFDLYQRSERLQEDVHFTIAAYRELLSSAVEMAKLLLANQGVYQHKLSVATEDSSGDQDLVDATQSHYSTLFGQFDDAYYYDQSRVLLQERYFERNGLEIPFLQQKTALDGGCGGGRFSLVLKQMGFKDVHGIDFSAANINTAKAKRDARGITGVFYEHGNVLSLPYPDQHFDFVLSNGVLHHTPSIPRGLSEMHRVLRPGGTMLIYVMEKPGGIALDTIELLRAVMTPVRPSFARKAMSVFGAAGHRIYTLLDHTLVPINTRSTPEELQEMLTVAGFSRIQRLSRGLPSDKVEKLRRVNIDDNDAVWKYGIGENRYYCYK